jgi:hypothetical protein
MVVSGRSTTDDFDMISSSALAISDLFIADLHSVANRQ